jgi:hypothetical protein
LYATGFQSGESSMPRATKAAHSSSRKRRYADRLSDCSRCDSGQDDGDSVCEDAASVRVEDGEAGGDSEEAATAHPPAEGADAAGGGDDGGGDADGDHDEAAGPVVGVEHAEEDDSEEDAVMARSKSNQSMEAAASTFDKAP